MQEEIQPEVVFKTALQRLMDARGLIQEQLAKELGVTQAAVSKWVQGSIPKPETLVKIAIFFNVTIDFLLRKQPAVVLPTPSSNTTRVSYLNGSEDKKNPMKKDKMLNAITPIKSNILDAIKASDDLSKALKRLIDV
jgi:transcriptional regulator with XRE-family HTH domain